MVKKGWVVQVAKTETYSGEVYVEAETAEEAETIAEELALDEGPDDGWDFQEQEIIVDSVWEETDLGPTEGTCNNSTSG